MDAKETIQKLKGGRSANTMDRKDVWEAFKDSNIDTFAMWASSDWSNLIRNVVYALLQGITEEELATELSSGDRGWNGTMAHVAARFAPVAVYNKLAKKHQRLLESLINDKGETPNAIFAKRADTKKNASRERAINAAQKLGIKIRIVDGRPFIQLEDEAKLRKSLGLQSIS